MMVQYRESLACDMHIVAGEGGDASFVAQLRDAEEGSAQSVV